MCRTFALVVGLLWLGQGSTGPYGPSSSSVKSSQANLRDALALPASLPEWAAPRPRLIPAGGRAVTPLSPDRDGWTLPGDAPQMPEDLPVQARFGATARRTWPVVELLEVSVSRDARWTRVTLELSSPDGAALSLAGLHVAAVGELGSLLPALPGLYSRAGTVQPSIPAGQTLVASCWIMLPTEGHGDTALLGTELASALILFRADDSLRLDLRLPRPRR